MRLWCAALLVALGNCAAVVAAVPHNRLLVDTKTLTATLVRHDRSPIVFPHISIGRFGATRDKRRGDNQTPVGKYRVAWVKRGAPFSIFIGIDYPSVADADRGLAAHLISRSEHRAILDAHAAGRIPPQTTALGGYLGLHGLGEGDPVIHATYNWTRGCMALTNDQIADLLSWVWLGTPVEIR